MSEAPIREDVPVSDGNELLLDELRELFNLDPLPGRKRRRRFTFGHGDFDHDN